MSYNPNNPNGQATMANSAPVVIASNQTAVPVSGTFFQATQPVSLASLPSLAAGSNAIGSITNTSFASTQSGNWSVRTQDGSGNAITSTSNALDVNIKNASIAVTGTFWQATQPVSGTVTANVGTTGGLALDATLTGGTQKTRITDGSTDAEIVPLTGYNAQAVAIVDGTGTQITSFGGGTQYADGAARGGSGPTGTVMMVDDGTLIQSAAGTSAGELKTVTVPNTSGGLSANRLTLTNSVQNVNSAGAAGQVYGWYVYNPNTTIAYVQFFNSAAAGVTLGTNPPVYSIGIPGLSAANVFNSIGIAHGSGISVAATATSTGSGTPGTALEVNVFYK